MAIAIAQLFVVKPCGKNFLRPPQNLVRTREIHNSEDNQHYLGLPQAPLGSNLQHRHISHIWMMKIRNAQHTSPRIEHI